MIKACGIYKIQNNLTNKCYVGSSVQIEARLKQHKAALENGNHHSIYLQRSWDKHGSSSFVFEILELCIKEKLIEREQHYIDKLNSCYNAEKIAGRPPHDSERSRKVMKQAWDNGSFDHCKRAIERINPNTGEVEDYESIADAVRKGFEQSCIWRCLAGLTVSYANYYWQYADGSTPVCKAAYDKVFINVVGTHTITEDQIKLSSFKMCKEFKFNYGKIRACCSGKKGRRTHRGYKWSYANLFTQYEAEKESCQTFADVFYKAVLRIDPKTGCVVRYESQAATKKDGFRPGQVSNCCRGKRKSHGGYFWKYAEN